MMICIRSEELLTLRQAARMLPSTRGNKGPHVSTLYRWAQRGVRGCRLETIPVGGIRCTSVEALQRFFDALAAEREGAGGEAWASLPKGRQESRRTRTARILREAGIQ